ncbi:syntaxin-11-like [Clinocottus analis]|uniref:syntaxin-11-like n=1 Tax=Clinocottus analis TaxID=304258 RepID=UPI0035BEDAC5
MRNRLRSLQQVQADSEGAGPSELDCVSDVAAASHPARDQELDGVLQEARQIHLEIQQIQSDVGELKDVNHRALNATSHPQAPKRDAGAIGVDVRRRGQAVLRRLHAMNALRGRLEARRGGCDPAARIAQTQYRCLSGALREAMRGYNDAEVSHGEACRRQIRQQMEVVDREVSAKELDEMMESGEWSVFGEQVEGRTARSAFLRIEGRRRELLELEKRIQGVQDLFLDVAVLTEEQGEAAADVQKNAQNAEVTVQEAVVQLDGAVASDKKNPFKKLLCCCFPCFNK